MSFWIRFISKGSRISAAGELLFAGAILLAAASATAPSRAQTSGTPIRIDASQPYREPGPARYDEGSATTPSGVTLGLTAAISRATVSPGSR